MLAQKIPGDTPYDESCGRGRGLASFAFAGSLALPAQAQEWVLPMAAKPEDVGLSSTQLKRLEAATQKHVDDGLVPGAVMLVARRGKVAWVSTLGKRDPAASPDPMKADLDLPHLFHDQADRQPRR